MRKVNLKVMAVFGFQRSLGIAEPIEPFAVLVHAHKGLRRFIGVVVGGKAGGVEDGSAFLHALSTHPAREQRLRGGF